VKSVVIRDFGSFSVRRDKGLIDLLIEKRIPVIASCGGHGRCELCRVKIKTAKDIPDEIESILVPDRLLEHGYRLACRYRVNDNIEVSIPVSGALMVLSNDRAIKHVKEIQKRCAHIELANQSNFQKVCISALQFAPWN